MLRHISDENASAASAAHGEGASGPLGGAVRSRTVLVVEDSVLVRLAIAEWLRDEGYRVLEAATAEEARALFLTREHVHLVFSDVNLPGHWDGTQLAHWVRDRFPNVKLILTSGEWRDPSEGLHVAVNGEQTFYDLFLPKPYLAEEVAFNVHRLLNRLG